MWAGLIGMIMQGVGSIIGAGVGKARDAYTIKTLKNNATINRAMAKDSISRGQVAEGMKRKEGAAFRGDQRATYGASGVDVDRGSAMRVQEDTTMINEIDALLIRENASREAGAYEQKAVQNEQQASMIKKASGINAVSTMLGGGTQMASSWYSSGAADA